MSAKQPRYLFQQDATGARILDQEAPTLCHHCGQVIAWNATWPDPRKSYWAHAIFRGKPSVLENALMQQRCANGRTWATPARKAKPLEAEPDNQCADGNPANYGD